MPETYDGTEGDAALAAGYSVMDGTEDRRQGYLANNRTRDMVAALLELFDGGLELGSGGTGATTAAGARANLGVQATIDDVAAAVATLEANKLVRANSAGQIAVPTPAYTTSPTPRSWVEAAVAGRVAVSGDTMTGHLYLPGATAASTGYTVAYIDAAGRVCRGASSRRYKRDLLPITARELGNIWPQFHTFKMRDGDDVNRYGYIAEDLAESDELEQFVIYARDVELDDAGKVASSKLARDDAGKPVPESIDFVGLLLAQVAQLHERDQLRERELEQLHERVAELEGRRA